LCYIYGMKKIYFILFLLIAGFQSNAQTTIIDSIFHGGLWRNYRVYVPAIYTGTSAVPLVLNLHGYTSNAMQQEFYGDFRPIADTANFILVHPNGTGPSTAQFWNAYTMSSPNDVGFIEALIDTISTQYMINANRVYTCGMSNGGIMSYYLAWKLNNKFAAIGSVTGSMTNLGLSTCAPTDNMPVIEIHGTADATVPYSGSSTFAPIDSIIDFWADYNACNPIPTVIPYANTATGDGCTATEYAYTGGTDESEVVLVKVTSGGHTWPGAPITIGVTNQDFDASVRLWQFFMKFDKSQFVGIKELEAKKTSINIYPNPVSDYIIFETDKTGGVLHLNDIAGRKILQTSITSPNQMIDLSLLTKGIYLGVYFDQTIKLIKE
jgi:polyhydroxybutyrate depolymerase